jgi:hypothetical protein
MADTLASAGANALRRSLPSSAHPLSWIKRRARRLQRAFAITRRSALVNARVDWSHFHTATTAAGSAA